MIEEGKAHFGGHELNKEDRDFLAKIIRLAIERKQKQEQKMNNLTLKFAFNF